MPALVCLQFFPKTLPGPQSGRAGATAPERPWPSGRAGRSLARTAGRVEEGAVERQRHQVGRSARGVFFLPSRLFLARKIIIVCTMAYQKQKAPTELCEFVVRNLSIVMERERAKRRMTKVDFARLCGMTPPAFLAILSGRANPTTDTITRISIALGVTMYELIYDDEDARAIATHRGRTLGLKSA
ncbi:MULTISPECIES: helix-turn-helix domain-containing protein [Agrobacterium]